MSVTKRRTKAVIRRQWVAHLACKWDVISGRERGCHMRAAYGFPCDFHGSAA